MSAVQIPTQSHAVQISDNLRRLLLRLCYSREEYALVLFLLTRSAEGSWTGPVTMSQLQIETATTERRVRQVVADLESSGVIKRRKVQGLAGFWEYRVCLESMTELAGLAAGGAR